jgi:hypothetical protein
MFNSILKNKNITVINNLECDIMIDENYKQRFFASGYGIENHKDYFYTIYIYYNIFTKKYEAKIYKHSIKLFSYQIKNSEYYTLKDIQTYYTITIKNNLEIILENEESIIIMKID